MAKQRRDQTISSVSDILGFVLEQAEKPVDKRRPVNAQTAATQSGSEYVSALVDTLALPGVFVNDQILATVQSLVDTEVSLQTQDRIGKVKVRASDLPDFFENPDDFVDKLFEKNRNIAKSSKLATFGEQMRSVIGSSYARKAGLFDDESKEMKNILVQAMGQSAMAGSAKDQAWMIDAAEKIMNKGHIASKLKNLENRRVNAKTEGELKQINSEIKGILNNYSMALNRVEKPEEFSPLSGFRGLLKDEFKARSEEILAGRDVKDLTDTEYEDYQKAQRANGMVGLWTESANMPISRKDFKEANENIKKAKEDLFERKEAIKSGSVWKFDGRSIDYSQYSSDQIRQELKGINGSLRKLNGANRDLGNMKLWNQIGKAEGIYHGLQNTFGPGGIEAALNGDFFDPIKGYFGCPTKKEKFKVSGKSGGEVGFLKPKYVEGQRLRNNYNDAMTNLYYANPTTWLRSLATGEAFAWMAYRQQEKLKKMWGVKEGDFTVLQNRGFWNFYRKFKGASEEDKLKLLSENSEYKNLMGRLKGVLGDKDSNLAKKFAKAEELFGSLERWGSFAKAFSAPARFKEEIINKFQTKFRNGLFSILSKMSMFSKDEAAMALLKSWKAVGGKALTGAISKAIVGALGLAGTAVAGPLGAVISFAVAAVLDKFMKVAIKVFIFALAGVFGIFMIIGGIGGTKKHAQVDGYSQVVPGEVQYNEDFESYGGDSMGLEEIVDEDGDGIPDYGPPGSLPEFVPGDLPPGMSCLFSVGPSLPCSQGPYSYCTKSGFEQPSHRNSPAIDVPVGGNFAAPQFCDLAQGNCVVKSVGQGTCGRDAQGNSFPAGGFVIFTAEYKGRVYQFYILHVSYGVSTGQKLGPGQAVATIADSTDWRSCSSGLHAHLTVQVNGSYVNPQDALNSDFGCSVASCPVQEVCYIRSK